MAMPKRGFITESDMSVVCKRYGASVVLTLLREVARCDTAVLDWAALVGKTGTGIKSPREYQALWRHLAYRTELPDRLDNGMEPLDDESDLEYEVEPLPHVLPEVAAEVAIRVKADLQRVGMGSIMNGKRKAPEGPSKSQKAYNCTQRTSTGAEKKQRKVWTAEENNSKVLTIDSISRAKMLQATGVGRAKASGPDPMVQAAAVAAGARIARASTAASLLKAVSPTMIQGTSNGRSGSQSSVHYIRTGSGAPPTLPQFQFQFGGSIQKPQNQSKCGSSKGCGLMTPKSTSEGSCSAGIAGAVGFSTASGLSGGSVCSSAAPRVQVGAASALQSSAVFSPAAVSSRSAVSSHPAPHDGVGIAEPVLLQPSVGSSPPEAAVQDEATLEHSMPTVTASEDKKGLCEVSNLGQRQSPQTSEHKVQETTS